MAKQSQPQSTPQVQHPTCASLNQADACKYIGISVATLQRLEAAGKAPPRLRMGNRSARYLVSSLDRWLAARSEPEPEPSRKRRASSQRAAA